MTFAFQYPIFGPEIQCPHCRQTIPALTLTDTYLDSPGAALLREHHHPWMSDLEQSTPRLFGLPVEFSPTPNDEPCWQVINFDLEKEPGMPVQYPFRMSL